jgi:hypothetical protein
MRRRCCALVLPLALPGGCQSSAPGAEAAALFAALEQRLLAAEHVEVEFEITAEGAVESEVRGILLCHGDFVSLFAQGSFMGRPAKVEMVSTERELRGGIDVAHILGPRPPALREGILLGLTRMGLLHNVAVLAHNHVPDGVEGSLGSWARADAFEIGDDGGLRFELIVAGKSTGRANLRLVDGLPSVREQVVQFAGGEMRVVERYQRFALGGG